MLRACGLVVQSLWAGLGKAGVVTHMWVRVVSGWVKLCGFVDRLRTYCTQYMHNSFVLFTPVIYGLYPLSTVPIKTTTHLKKGYK